MGTRARNCWINREKNNETTKANRKQRSKSKWSTRGDYNKQSMVSITENPTAGLRVKQSNDLLSVMKAKIRKLQGNQLNNISSSKTQIKWKVITRITMRLASQLEDTGNC